MVLYPSLQCIITSLAPLASELTLEPLALLQTLLPSAANTGRPRSLNLMSVVQSILYQLVTGCAWRLLPSECLPQIYFFALCVFFFVICLISNLILILLLQQLLHNLFAVQEGGGCGSY
ncbi:MAG: transposase [Synechococcales cyanobacterium C42_A2020_086]|nr:transposase [Synechococcales cyanobacterium C42_A2020_086]